MSTVLEYNVINYCLHCTDAVYIRLVKEMLQPKLYLELFELFSEVKTVQ